MKKLLLIYTSILLLSSCSSIGVVDDMERLTLKGEWLKAVIEYRKAYAENPDDIELRSRLIQTEFRAADFYYQEGLKMIELGNLDGAIVKFQQGLVSKSTHTKLSQAMSNVLARKEANSLYNEGIQNQKAGKNRQAIALFKKVVTIYPGHKDARRAIVKIKARNNEKKQRGLALKSKEPISLNFRQSELKTAIEFIVKSFGINVIFDEAVKNIPVTLFAKNVTFKQALNLILTTSKTFYRQVGVNTIIVAPDTKEKHGQYEDHIIRTFQLKTIKAKDMSSIIKGVITVKKLIINSELNSILIRDTKQVLTLVERLININDRIPAEMILDVDILEVNHTKAEKLGLDFGSEISTTFPQHALSSSLSSTLRAGTATIPAITFRYFKQDVDAKTLANPKIRVMHNKVAKIHIGDRVPLRSATITDSLGQTRTSFEYKDIGIRLTVEPNIHLDNSVTVKMGLEVSSLGQNLGTPQEPAFSIGTRNADTIMLLRDGETAILGGLIRDEERNTRVKVPGLGDIPVVGTLFSNYDQSDTRTDVLLTITPRVVRAWELPEEGEREIYSGSEKSFTDNPLFDYLSKETAGHKKSLISVNNVTGNSPSGKKISFLSDKNNLSINSGNLELGFSQVQYTANENSIFSITLSAEKLSTTKHLPLEILFNPQIMQFNDVSSKLETVESFSIDEDDIDKGVIRIVMQGLSTENTTELATLNFTAKKSGISYLIYRNKQYTNKDGKLKTPGLNASRVIVR